MRLLDRDAVVTTVASEPGDGTRYTAIIVTWFDPEAESYGALGAVRDGYLVVCGLNGKAYLLQRTDLLLHPAYVAEKFNLHPRNALHFARLLGRALNRPVPEITEEED